MQTCPTTKNAKVIRKPVYSSPSCPWTYSAAAQGGVVKGVTQKHQRPAPAFPLHEICMVHSYRLKKTTLHRLVCTVATDFDSIQRNWASGCLWPPLLLLRGTVLSRRERLKTGFVRICRSPSQHCEPASSFPATTSRSIIDFKGFDVCRSNTCLQLLSRDRLQYCQWHRRQCQIELKKYGPNWKPELWVAFCRDSKDPLSRRPSTRWATRFLLSMVGYSRQNRGDIFSKSSTLWTAQTWL